MTTTRACAARSARTGWLTALLLLGTAVPGSAQGANEEPAAALRAPPTVVRGCCTDRDAPPVLQALRVGGDVVLDGVMDETRWGEAPVATGFVQYEPDEGEPATERTEARVLYGSEALYVFMRAWDSRPDSIVGQVTRRDQVCYSDALGVVIDSYFDRRTAFHFAVNPVGVKYDIYRYDDTSQDFGWDAVWEVATSRDDQGWSAEFRIPYSFDVASTEPPRARVYDYENRRLSLLALEGPEAPRILEELRLESTAQLLHPYALAEGWISNGHLLEGSLVRFDAGGRPVERIRGAPPSEETPASLPVETLQRNLAHLVVRPDRNRLALAYQHLDRLDLFDAAGRRLRTTRGPRPVATRFRSDDRGHVGRPPGEPRAYLNVAATDAFLYLLYCGRCSEDRLPDRVHVYDWEGRFVREIPLSPGTYFALDVSPDGRRMLCVYEDETLELRLGLWTLPALPPQATERVARGGGSAQ